LDVDALDRVSGEREVVRVEEQREPVHGVEVGSLGRLG
jgi:hypothetical protein